MKNLPAELMWLESAKKQVEIAKDAYKEAKIHLLNSIKDTKKKIESGEYKMCNLNDPEFKIELD